MVFLSYFVYPFKNKTKKVATPNHFQIINKKSIFQIKIEFAIEWETSEHEIRGPQLYLELSKKTNTT